MRTQILQKITRERVTAVAGIIREILSHFPKGLHSLSLLEMLTVTSGFRLDTKNAV